MVRADPRTRLLTFGLEQPFTFTAGQAVYAGLSEGNVRRPYSIASPPAASRISQTLQLLVQIDDHSAPDPHLERVEIGTAVRVEGPFGSFGLPLPIEEREVLFVAGGTGIAPLRSMLGELLNHQPDIVPTLLYSARTPQEFAFSMNSRRSTNAGRLTLTLTVTRDPGSAWTGGRGRFDATHVRAALKTPATRMSGVRPAVDCVTSTITHLKDAGVAEERIGWEAF